jgi:hypothetical protein
MFNKTKQFEHFFSDVKKRSFKVKFKSKDQSGETISTSTNDVIKLSSLKNIIERHFGISIKDEKTITSISNKLI